MLANLCELENKRLSKLKKLLSSTHGDTIKLKVNDKLSANFAKCS